MGSDGLIRVDPEWQEFSRRHRGWIGRFPCGPLYYLPEASIARLGCPRLDHPPLLDADAGAAERDLLALCRRFHAVGFADGRPIIHSHFDPAAARSFRDDFPDHGFTADQWAQCEWLALSHSAFSGVDSLCASSAGSD